MQLFLGFTLFYSVASFKWTQNDIAIYVIMNEVQSNTNQNEEVKIVRFLRNEMWKDSFLTTQEMSRILINVLCHYFFRYFKFEWWYLVNKAIQENILYDSFNWYWNTIKSNVYILIERQDKNVKNYPYEWC